MIHLMKRILFTLLLCLAFVAVKANVRQQYAWTGKLGPSISFLLELEENYNGFVSGETTYYRKNGKQAHIRVYGSARHDGDYTTLMLNEYDGTRVCGHFNIQLNGEWITDGFWTLDEKNLQMNNLENVRFSRASFFHLVDATQAEGVYKFAYSRGKGLDDGVGHAQLCARGGEVAYTFCQVTPNIAEARGFDADPWGNNFSFAVGNACFVVQTYADCLYCYRTNPDDGPCEGFGAWATIEGVYIACDDPVDSDVRAIFTDDDAFNATLPCDYLQTLNEAWKAYTEGETTYPDEIITRDIDGDGQPEIIGRYLPDASEGYDVKVAHEAVFACIDGVLVPIAHAEGKLQSLAVAPGYVILHKVSKSGGSVTDHYYRLSRSQVVLEASSTQADIDNYTINGATATAKEFRREIRVEKVQPLSTLTEWRAVPGNQYRNEHAPRG